MDETGWTDGNDRTGRTAGHPYIKYGVPAMAALGAGANYAKTAAGTYLTWRTMVPTAASKAASDATAVFRSVVGNTADEKMYKNEDTGLAPSKAVVQHKVQETKKGIEQQG